MQPALKRQRVLPSTQTHPEQPLQPKSQDHSEDAEEGLPEVPSDVLAALLFLRNDLFGPQQALLPPLLLKSHIYTVLADRTDVDRDLDELQRKGSVRLFKLTSGVDEYGIMLASDYTELIQKVMQAADAAHRAQQQQEPEQLCSSSGRSGAPGQTASPPRGLTAFLQNVLPACPDTKVPGSLLLQLLSKPVKSTQAPTSRGRLDPGRPVTTSAGAGGAADAAVSQLLSAGLLLRDAVTDGAYLFTVPKAGVVVKALTNGRKELTGLLAKKRYKEAPEKELLTKQKLRGSSLSMKYHIRDLLGRGVAQRVTTPSGTFIKLVKL